MVSYLRQILGTYTPYQGEGIAALNIEWITAAAILLVGFISIFRILGKLFK